MKMTRTAPLAASLLLLAAGCGGSSAPAPVPTHAVRVTVSGLAGAGLALHLGPATPGQDLAVTADGAVQFPGKLPEGSAYAVTVKTQPASPWQDCTPGGGPNGDGTGAMGTADAALTVTCTTRTFGVGGAVSGLTGPGLSLRLNGGPALAVDADGAFSFPPVPSGTAFKVTVATHPQAPRQACEVVGASGEGTVQDQAVTSVQVTCRSDVHTVGGTVTGRAGSGLLLRLEVAGVIWGDDLAVSSTSFAYPAPVPEGEPWVLTVSQQPTVPWQTCDVVGGVGVMGAADVSTVEVVCSTNGYAVRGHAAGLLLPGLTVRLTVDGAPGTPLAVDADGAFTLRSDVASGRPFLVAVASAPPTQACAVTAPADVVAGTAVMAGADVDVTVACGCAPGLGNCDGLPGNGCELDVTGDLANCGACGTVCAFAHAGASCQAGACQPGACDPGFASCDGNAANGCELPVSADPANCGGCATVCAPAHAPPACALGQCGHGACAAGWGDCDGNAANGCEHDVTADVSNCGACGNACNLANAVPACAAGQCAVSACKVGFGNCDGQAANGCESDLSTDALNCLQCGRACNLLNTVPTCVAAACTADVCTPGFVDCNRLAVDGCEIDILRDPANCGGCSQPCQLPHALPACSAGTCTTGAGCESGFGNCDGLVANGCETITTDNPQNCGSCGVVCGADQKCAGTSCVGYSSCNDILLAGKSIGDGTYTIDPAGNGATVDVYCDMTTEGGGWTFFGHLAADYPAGDFFSQDVTTAPFDPTRGDTVRSYALGATVYQHLGATRLLVTLDTTDVLTAITQSKFIGYKPIPSQQGVLQGFSSGPVPCSGLEAGFEYRLDLGSYVPGISNGCDADLWYPYTRIPDPFTQGAWLPGEPLTVFTTGGLGTFWGTGMGGDGSSVPHQSWWYAR